MVRHVCDSFSPFLTPRPGTARVDCTCKYGAPKGAPFPVRRHAQSPVRWPLLVAEGWSLPLILHLIPSALKGSAKVERLRPRLIASRDAVNRGVKNEQKTTGSFSG